MVQARWGHMNRDISLLTRVQALMLDGHHLVENRARSAAGLALQLLRHRRHVAQRRPSQTRGGWQHDTLTEDLDLSYRAQLAGWKFVYREDVVSPAELPEDVSAFRAQQYRWAKGTVQTARKLMKPRADARDLTLDAARRGVLPPDAALRVPADGASRACCSCRRSSSCRRPNPRTMLLIDLPLCIGTTGSLAAFYAMAEAAQGRRRLRRAQARSRRSSRSARASRRTSRRPCSRASARWPASSSARRRRATRPRAATAQRADLPMVGGRALPPVVRAASSPRSRPATGSRRRSRCSSRSATATSPRSSRSEQLARRSRAAHPTREGRRAAQSRRCPGRRATSLPASREASSKAIPSLQLRARGLLIARSLARGSGES